MYIFIYIYLKDIYPHTSLRVTVLVSSSKYIDSVYRILACIRTYMQYIYCVSSSMSDSITGTVSHSPPRRVTIEYNIAIDIG